MSEFWEHKYFNTYYYSNIIDNISTGDIELIGFISDFFNENLRFVQPFEKFSAFHQFINYIVFRFLHEDMHEHDVEVFRLYERDGEMHKLYAEKLLKKYAVATGYEGFDCEEAPILYKHIEEYHDAIMEAGYLEELCENITHEVFYILFNNRDLLIRFNQIVAGYVTEFDKETFDEQDAIEFGAYFKKPGILERVNIPQWVKEAVYFREKGRCCLCGTDITAILRTGNHAHYDHMVPLYYGGINDVSNIQLLCSTCNLKKGRKDIVTSTFYFKWYD